MTGDGGLVPVQTRKPVSIDPQAARAEMVGRQRRGKCCERPRTGWPSTRSTVSQAVSGSPSTTCSSDAGYRLLAGAPGKLTSYRYWRRCARRRRRTGGGGVRRPARAGARPDPHRDWRWISTRATMSCKTRRRQLCAVRPPEDRKRESPTGTTAKAGVRCSAAWATLAIGCTAPALPRDGRPRSAAVGTGCRSCSGPSG